MRKIDGSKQRINPTLGLLFVIVTIIFFLGLSEVFADPTPPTGISAIQSSRFNSSLYPAVNISAIAGNVTELSIIGVSPTSAWQGYYGNITGTITLEDASGNVFYNWSVAEPKGEIYATYNGSVTWSNIACFNFTANGSIDVNLTDREAAFGISSLDSDGIDETFNYTSHPTLIIGGSTILNDTCPSTYIYTYGAGAQTEYFSNVLLSDNSSLIFTTVIENDDNNNNTDINGFNNVSYDFQMLVAEDGHGVDTDATPYFFWVELQ